ncbi:MAG: helix-turn-helix domain-containing protein [Terracidiphilus sp.]|jgi:transcriptional regulator with XRE-family HTH domain
MERDVEGDYRLDWPRLVETAKARRKQLNLTQRRLAAVAGVSLPTVVGLEAGEDLRLSSALKILRVLDMVESLLEGTLWIRSDRTPGTAPYEVTYSPYSGAGGTLERKPLPDLEALNGFLDLLRLSKEQKQEAHANLTRGEGANILGVRLSPTEARRYWPTQFAAA